ncbi:MAG: thioredoxin family protein [Caldilineaceae bacterium]
MIERFIILGMLLAGVGIAVLAWRQWRVVALRRLQTHDLPAPLAALDLRVPTLLYFTADHCAQCKLQQAPVLEQLHRAYQVPIHTIDAVAEPDLARYFNVMTVPTTVVLDTQRRPAAINYGLAPLARLHEQLQAAGVA